MPETRAGSARASRCYTRRMAESTNIAASAHGIAPETLARIKRELDSVPTRPGVYLWKNAAGEVIYVGKSKQLRARMRQ